MPNAEVKFQHPDNGCDAVREIRSLQFLDMTLEQAKNLLHREGTVLETQLPRCSKCGVGFWPVIGDGQSEVPGES